MGRGNVSVNGTYEGVYYIDYDHICTYCRKGDDSDYPEIRLMGDLSCEELTGGDWLYDEENTAIEEESVLEGFMDSFQEKFPSFARPESDIYLKSNQSRAILENGLFYIAIEDNEWSLAVELLQKEDPYDNHLSGLQSRHCQKYLDGIKRSLLECLPSIGVRTGAWTSDTITREDV